MYGPRGGTASSLITRRRRAAKRGARESPVPRAALSRRWRPPARSRAGASLPCPPLPSRVVFWPVHSRRGMMSVICSPAPVLSIRPRSIKKRRGLRQTRGRARLRRRPSPTCPRHRRPTSTRPRRRYRHTPATPRPNINGDTDPDTLSWSSSSSGSGMLAASRN